MLAPPSPDGWRPILRGILDLPLLHLPHRIKNLTSPVPNTLTFPDWKMPSHFSRFSSPSGNPEDSCKGRRPKGIEASKFTNRLSPKPANGKETFYDLHQGRPPANIRPTSSRYASYWNAVLLVIRSTACMRSMGKVMFSHASVILSWGRDQGLPTSGCTPLPVDPPPHPPRPQEDRRSYAS